MEKNVFPYVLPASFALDCSASYRESQSNLEILFYFERSILCFASYMYTVKIVLILKKVVEKLLRHRNMAYVTLQLQFA